MTGGKNYKPDLIDVILNQAVLERKNILDGLAKERFIKLPPSHQQEWAHYISEAKKMRPNCASK